MTLTREKPEVTGYRTEESLFATRYTQGGRTVYSVALTPEQIVNLVPRIDPETSNPGNRRIRPAHAQAFGRYFIEHEEWVSPGIILRAPGIFTFASTETVAGADFGVLSYSKRDQGDIQILDGQHRILGFQNAMEQIDKSLDKARSQRAEARRTDGSKSAGAHEAERRIKVVEGQRDRFYSDRVNVEIHVVEDMKEYRQMFFDIADNALGITASVKARFDTRKVVNRALPAILEHPLLANRVDLETDRLGRTSQYILSARHVMETARSLAVGLEGRVSRRMDAEMKEAEVAANTRAFFDMLVGAFPQYKAVMANQMTPQELRKSTLLGSSLFVRILAGVAFELKSRHAFSEQMVRDYFAALSQHISVPVAENSIWVAHTPEGTFTPGATAPNGRRQDSRGLMETMVDWAVDREKFVTEKPAPAPAAEGDDDDISELTPEQVEAFDKLAGPVAPPAE